MDILSYLSELIQTRKSVGISGLGTVYKKKSPGRYDADTHSFVPPSYTLDFTAEVKEDVLLAEYISKKRNVSTDTSNHFINEFSSALLKELNDHNEANLGSLGKLFKTGDELRFEPAEKMNYGFDFFGLPSVKAEQESRAEEIIPSTPNVEEPEPVEVVAPVVPEPVKPIEAAPVIETAEEQVLEDEAEETIAENVSTEETITEEIVAEEAAPEEETAEPVKEEITEEPGQPVTVTEEQPAAVEEQPVAVTEEPIQEQPAAVTEEPAISAPATPEVTKPAEVTETPVRKDEHQLRAEIEALNYYRSNSPVTKTPAGETEEVIWHIKDTVPTANLPVEPAAVTEPTGFYQSEDEQEVKRMPGYLKVFIAILVLALIVVGAYFLKPEWFSQFTGKVPATTQQAIIPPAAVNDSLADTVKTAIPEKTAAAQPVKKDSVVKAAPVTAKAADTVVLYEIIGASMHDQKEADNFIAQMKKSGIDAKVVTNMAGKRLKMSIATLKDEKSAQLELKRLSEKLKIPGIYIYRNKQK